MVIVGKQILVANTVEKSLHTTTECLYSSLIGVRECLFGPIAQPDLALSVLGRKVNSCMSLLASA